MNTMELEIDLAEYLEMGGDINKVEWDRFYCGYGDSNCQHKVISFEDKGETSPSGIILWWFTFENGNTRRYALSWIKLRIDVVLHPKYEIY